jgi:hypothetical protein
MVRQPFVVNGLSSVMASAGALLLLFAVGCGGSSNSVNERSTSVRSLPAENSIAGEHESTKASPDGEQMETEPADSQSNPIQDAQSPGANSSLEIVIEPSKAEDAGRFEVMIRVTNRSPRPAGWDKECSSFIKWNAVDGKGERVEPKEEPVERGVASKDRFTLLQPGDTYSHSFDLVKGVRQFFHARAAVSSPTGESLVVPTGNEFLARYEFHNVPGKLRLSLEFDSNDADARDGFAVYFGFRPESVGIDGLTVSSNTLQFSVTK